MDQFSGAVPFWDISQTPNTISQLPDDDFLALLQKQFPSTTNSFSLSFPGFTNTGVDPQSLTNLPYTIPNASPPSSDSSPSPPSADTDPGTSRRQSTQFGDKEDNSLKRKASDEDMDVEPSYKSPHISSNSAKKSTTRRKSGNPTQDEVRLLKRKEQNRAAQRAFRERKEKHVKDLEDKVASLEARNLRTESENENLRDLLSRLQEENVQLKQQSSFTFSVQKDQAGHFSSGSNVGSSTTSKSPSQGSTFSSTSPVSSKFTVPASPRFLTPNSNSEFNFGSLIPFDPAVLNALDDTHSTGPEDAMNLDFGFGKQTRPSFNILASDPTYMSFAEPSPSDSTSGSSPANSFGSFDFSSLDSWSRSGSQSNIINGGNMQTLDELFGGNNSFLTAQTGMEFVSLLKNTSPGPTVSPIIHAAPPSATNHSPLSNTTDTGHGEQCPKTKAQLHERIVHEGLSTFAPSSAAPTCETGTSTEPGTHPFLKKNMKEPPMVMCRGSSFPKTEQNEKNIEVLSAWRSITSNPQFKDVDINELCTEFTDKARCDGTKVVLEPEGVHSIIESLNAKYQKQMSQRI